MATKIKQTGWILCGLLLTLLTSCGFHLRGHEELPSALQTIYIQSDTPYGGFEQTLRESLRTYNINIVDTPEQANTILDITAINFTQVAGSVSATMSLRQYTLNYQVSYQVLSSKGAVIIPNLSVTSSTTFTSNMAEMMLSSKNATAQYLPNLQRDAVFRMISRLVSTDSKTALEKYMRQHPRTHHEN